jgi:hypothetical protein
MSALVRYVRNRAISALVWYVRNRAMSALVHVLTIKLVDLYKCVAILSTIQIKTDMA